MGNFVFDRWPEAPEALDPALATEFLEHAGNGRVGSRLVSETDRVRVWSLTLKPGERIGFHTHVLDYFWTAVNGGKAISHYGDGRVVEASYAPGDTKHHHYGRGEFMIHDLKNVGDTDLIFTTVEFKDSENAPLSV